MQKKCRRLRTVWVVGVGGKRSGVVKAETKRWCCLGSFFFLFFFFFLLKIVVVL